MNHRQVRRGAFVLAALAIVVLLTGVCFNNLPPRLTRGPYLQLSSPTSVAIRWRTSKPARVVVRYGTDANQLVHEMQVGMRGTDHSIVLPELNPATTYHYEIALASESHLPWPRRHTFSFTTPPQSGSAEAVRVWVLGDSGTGNSTQAAVRDAFRRFSDTRTPDVWLMLGDNAYMNGRDEQYQTTLFAVYSDMLSRTTLWPTIGNHDARSADSATQSGVYFDVFSLPTQGQCGGVMSGTEAYYSFDHANIHFICLDSQGSDRSTNGPMLTWLREDLKNNHQDWTIAYWHHPPYTKGSHDSDIPMNGDERMREMRENALPILEAAGVDLVLGGHSHDYERSFLLAGHYGASDSLNTAMIVDARDGNPDRQGAYVKAARGLNTGTVYVVAGSSGETGDPIKTPHPAMCISTNVPGSLVIDVRGAELKANFLDDKGQTLDRFAIVKGDSTELLSNLRP